MTKPSEAAMSAAKSIETELFPPNRAAVWSRERLAVIIDREAIAPLQAEIARLRKACVDTEHEVQQILGKALGYYPWHKDDQKNFPGATEADGVCVGDHVAATLAMEVVDRIRNLQAKLDVAMEALKKIVDEERNTRQGGSALEDYEMYLYSYQNCRYMALGALAKIKEMP